MSPLTDRHETLDEVVDHFVLADVLQQVRCVQLAAAQSFEHVVQCRRHVVWTLVAYVVDHVDHLHTDTTTHGVPENIVQNQKLHKLVLETCAVVLTCSPNRQQQYAHVASNA